ncbi:LysR family transcriptional regulator, partial [Streptomyces sp. SID3915]|uniref:helix-turn-helix domain-containing protein n=4 Tax=Streptomyces TaxID=1883 RepID=UPI001371664C
MSSPLRPADPAPSDSGGARPPRSLPHRVPDLGAMVLLLSVARHGSLGRAARDVGITQPAASSRIRSM